MKSKLTLGVMLITLTTSLYGLSPYVKGYKLYIRYVKHIPKYGIKAPQLLKSLGVNSTEELEKLIDSGEIVEKVEKFNPKAAEGIKKILKKDKKSFKFFLKSVYEGKIPLGCS
ncbi:hypothetical protein JCM11957_09500 [Caminibacter profundus]